MVTRRNTKTVQNTYFSSWEYTKNAVRKQWGKRTLSCIVNCEFQNSQNCTQSRDDPFDKQTM